MRTGSRFSARGGRGHGACGFILLQRSNSLVEATCESPPDKWPPASVMKLVHLVSRLLNQTATAGAKSYNYLRAGKAAKAGAVVSGVCTLHSELS